MGEKKKSTVWQARMRSAPSERHVAYCAGWDVRERPPADAVLVPYDIWCNQAHALMLCKAGIIDRPTHRKIQRALAATEREWRAGKWQLDPSLEDVHINVERSVSERAGAAAGGRLHTARSRNDQTATDVRLYLRDSLLAFHEALLDLASELVKRGREHAETLAVGLSHTQPASVITFGHFLAAHAQALLRDAGQMQATYAAINVNPLGSAAGFGTSWPIDRGDTAKSMGFSGVQENSLDCVSSRWEMEARFVSDLAFAGNHLAMFAQDLVLMSQPWVGFVEFDDAHVTGSSIMPQKRNPDFAEVTRARVAVVHGVLQSLLAMNKGMVSGYNRDSQWSKYQLMNAVEELRDTPSLFREALASLNVNTERMAAAADEDFLVAVDLADLIARRGDVPFRKSYEIVARLVRDCEASGRFEPERVAAALNDAGLSDRIPRKEWMAATTPNRVVKTRKSVGGPAPAALRACLKRLEADVRHQRQWGRRQSTALEKARAKMLERIRELV